MKKTICEAKNIGKEYFLSHGQILPVLQDFNLPIYPGEIVALIGPSGCGKSTFLRILSGLEAPTKGKIFYKGKAYKGLLPDSAIVFQSFALYPWMTVKENIGLVLKPLGLSKEKIESKTKEVISKTGLGGFEEVYPKELSGGMKQRVGLARALVRDPSLLLMDEPFSALDAFTAEGLRSEIIKIWEAKDFKLSSIVLISHEIAEVVYMADKIVVLGSSPGHILNIFENKLPRPRDYRSTPFLNLMNLIHNTYYKKESVPSSSSPVSPLFSVGSDAILGLLRHIEREKGTCDLYKISKEIHQHFDETIRVAESAELLHFVEVVHQTALLTEIGKAYVEATYENRRKIWKKQVVLIPLFSKIFEWIQRSPGRILTKQTLLSQLSKELPNENASTQLKTLLRWGHYGKLFKIEKKGISLLN